MNEQEKFWSGEFGNEYTRRNQVDWRARIPFWREVIDLTGARSVHEFGCNAGWNLSAIKRAYDDVDVSGVDINKNAIQQARCAGLSVSVAREMSSAELMFTAGVLIHVGPDELPQLMQQIVKASYRYVLAIEYADDKEVEVEYRGHTGKLWRRPYGQLYQDMGLKLVRHWPDVYGFDKCAAWLLEK